MSSVYGKAHKIKPTPPELRPWKDADLSVREAMILDLIIDHPDRSTEALVRLAYRLHREDISRTVGDNCVNHLRKHGMIQSEMRLCRAVHNKCRVPVWRVVPEPVEEVPDDQD